MIKTAVLSITTATSLTYGATALYEEVRGGAMKVAGVYAAAGAIVEAGGSAPHLDAQLYRSAEQLTPYSQIVLTP